MKLAISSIAWPNEAEGQVAQLLTAAGLQAVEVAPTKWWPDPTAVDRADVDAYRSWWHERGLSIVAVQSMLFGRADLTLFDSADTRVETLAYLVSFAEVSARLGARAMVFGSPKNRVRGPLPAQEAADIAVEFFGDLAHRIAPLGVTLCLEPNAAQYGCDFVTTAADGIALVRRVATEGFALHLDTGCMALAGDDPAEAIAAAGSTLEHFHISEPFLGPVGQAPIDAVPVDGAPADTVSVDSVAASAPSGSGVTRPQQPVARHREAAAALRGAGYRGYCSIEMRPAPDPVAAVEAALQLAAGIYGTDGAASGTGTR